MADYLPPDFAPGSIWVVGGGSGYPGYLSLLALHALRQSDVVFHDTELAKDVVSLANKAKTIAVSTSDLTVVSQLAARAQRGQRVVRLFLGDPLFFAAGAELAVLAESGLPVRVVPGISNAAYGMANAGIPATHRETNSSVCFIQIDDTLPHSFEHLTRSASVLVIELDTSRVSAVRDRLLSAGLGADLLVTVVSLGPTAQVINQTELANLSCEIAQTCNRILLVTNHAKRLFVPAV